MRGNLSATQLIYQAAGYWFGELIEGMCAVCGGQLYGPAPLKDFIRSSFMDHHILRGGDWICSACAYCWTEYNEDVMRRAGKETRQKFRNYSHFVQHGEWRVYSKGGKAGMAALLLSGTVPEVAIIAVSGQKHLAIKARSNPPGQPVGWLMFEEQHVDFNALHFARIYGLVEQLYQAGYTKEGVLTGRYTFYRDSNIDLWRAIEPQIKPLRGDLHLEIAVYLVTKRDDAPTESDESDE